MVKLICKKGEALSEQGVVIDFIPWQVCESLISHDGITILRAENGEILVKIAHHRPFFRHAIECVAMELRVVGLFEGTELIRGRLFLLSRKKSCATYAFDADSFDDTGKFSFYYRHGQPISCNVAKIVFTIGGERFPIDNVSYYDLAA